MADLRSAPVELSAPRGAHVVQITWGDGFVASYPHRLLRGFCPCAFCQGHQGPIRFRDVPSSEAERSPALELVEIEEVGNYAVRLVWGDGHGTGIYAFKYLRELGEPTALPPESRSFAR